MSKDTDKELYKLIGKYEAFSAHILTELSDVKISLKAGDIRISNMEKSIADKGVCLLHQEIVERLDKKDMKDENHDKKISDIQSDVRVVEFKLTTRDMAKISVIAAGIAAPIIELLKWIITQSL